MFPLLLLLFLFQGCKKDEDLGLDIIDLPGDRFGMNYTDTCTVTAWSVFEDSLQTSGVFLNLLGSYSDPVFGVTTAGIYTQALLSTNNVSFGDQAVGDSLILTLRFNGFYGNSTASHRVRVYEIDPSTTFHKDSTYYSNQSLPLGDLLFDQVVQFNPTDSTWFNGNKVPPLLKLHLNSTLIQKFINASGTGDLANNADFVKFFKGLYITVNNMGSENQGSIGYFNLTADLSALTLFYHNDKDTLVYPFVINDECARFTNFNHNGYLAAEQGLLMQDTNGNNDRLYLQATAGVKIRVKFPNIKALMNEGPVGIARAELVLKPDPTDFSASTFTHPPKLTVVRINDEGKNAFIPDFLEGETFMGGTYDPVRGEYRFRITRHLQALLNEQYTDHGLAVLVSGASVLANRVAIHGNSPTVGKNLRLEIVFANP
jgi:hypothetical protein